MQRSLPDHIGRYRITGLLGRGGMGVVYEAHDDQLDRPVAIKMVRGSDDPQSAARLRREARAAAAVSHPGICQVHEIGEHGGQLFIAMERLEGESLATRVGRGSLPVAEAVQTMLGVLGALRALHERGLVHRDLKPSNVFLTPHGVKLLDFGIVGVNEPDGETRARLTAEGAITGTPPYMSPEQITNVPVDARSDLFAAGVILYEALTGTPPFSGGSFLDIARAITDRHPPALSGSPAIVAVDRAIHRALAKRSADRYASAEAMAADLRAAMALVDSSAAVEARPLVRLIVLPFRLLRPDAEIGFLSFSLADAIAASLTGLQGLVVRSSATAMRYAEAAPDLAALAREADVDHVLMGTILRVGSQLRVSTQLVETPVGTLGWSHTAQVAVGDLFQIQDDLTTRIVRSLVAPLASKGSPAPRRDVPATAAAYEHYLRANQLGLNRNDWPLARELYRRCIDEDPRFAPAWARFGHMVRLSAKYSSGDPRPAYAEAARAVEQALILNPDLSMAHTLYAALESETGRAIDALGRLIERAKAHPPDPVVFAGLVHACRYCGLLEASVAAHEHAKRLDPTVRTSVAFTHLAAGDWVRAQGAENNDIHGEVMSLAMQGRTADAIAACKRRLARETFPVFQFYGRALLADLEGDRSALRPAAGSGGSGWHDVP